MGKKKFLSMITALAVMVCVLVGCGNNALPYTTDFIGKLPSGYVAANAQVRFGTPLTGYTKAVKLPSDYVSVDTSYSSSGYLKVGQKKDDKTKYGVYSMTEEKMIIDCIYANVSISTLVYNEKLIESIPNRTQVIVRLQSDNDRRGVYNLSEKNFMIPMGDYSSVSVQVSGSVEIRTTIGDSGTVITEYEAIVNNDWTVSRTRLETVLEAGSALSPAQNLVTYPHFPALDGYGYRMEGSKLIAYKDGKQVFEVLYSFGGSVSANSFQIGKYKYFQYEAQLPDDAKDYTYSQSGKKYRLTTSRLDMTKGSVTELKGFEYVIGSTTLKLDKDGKYSYLQADCARINRDRLLDVSISMLFNEKLGEVVNLSLYSFGSSILKMSDDRYLSGSSILDANGKIIANLSGCGDISYCANANVISLSRDDVYGLIDTDGIVLVAFEYVSPFNFYNSIARNKNYFNDTTYLINKSGMKTLDASGSSGSVNSDIKGIFYEFKEGDCIIKNYAGAQLAKIEDCSNIYAPATFGGDASSYLSGQLIRAVSNGSSVYYILK